MASFRKSESALGSIVEGLPDDLDRIRILEVLVRHDGPMPLGSLADEIGQSSDLLAEILVGAAKDGLVSFSADSRSVSLTELGRKIAGRTARN
jgi:Mn-dependent DtxR family transcriptional regulator